LAETDYGAILQNLPEPLRSQMLYGDFGLGVEDNPYQVIPTEWIEAAMSRWQESGRADRAMSALGVDVARGGRDKTVIAPLHGNWFGPLKKYAGKETPDGQSVAALAIAAHDGEAVIGVDVIGIGSSAFDCLRQAGVKKVLGINFGEGTTMTDKSKRLKMRNVRAGAYWSLREALDPSSGVEMALPNDPELLADLTSPRWSLSAGKILIESKEDIIDRIGRSPDAGDAVALGWWAAKTQGGTDWQTVKGLGQVEGYKSRWT
jgi:hypothetical protein